MPCGDDVVSSRMPSSHKRKGSESGGSQGRPLMATELTGDTKPTYSENVIGFLLAIQTFYNLHKKINYAKPH